jgi:DNA adenine methylase
MGEARPFLKWAGGKAALAPLIVARIPDGTGVYREPFLGGGAAFFAVRAARPDLPAVLNDANEELVTCYRVVRDCPDGLIAALGKLAADYLPLAEGERTAYYYARRAETPGDDVRRAARTIFLNRTGYNGLYRVNSTGRFNVPHGRYRSPGILDEERIRAAAVALRGVELTCGDFEAACATAEAGDFVYLDPPYQPLSATAHFTAYTSADFGLGDQRRLAAAFARMAARGVHALLSNSDHPLIRELYEGRGYRIDVVRMSRAINSKANGRAPVAELLIGT